jgi:hypothetical protein
MTRNDDRDLARLDALFAADPGPSASELAEARLELKRSLAQTRRGRDALESSTSLVATSPAVRSPLLRLGARREVRLFAQAAGFALLVALLVPFVPRMVPSEPRPVVDVVASLAGEARLLGERLKPWMPPLPRLPPVPSFSSLPKRPLFDWVPTSTGLLHSDAR